MPPCDPHNVRVEFEIVDPYFRYIWTGGSYLKVNSADFLGKRAARNHARHERPGSYELSSRSRFRF